MKAQPKGISPLIASVVLIAVTLAIAGILSTWAIQFVGGRGTAITQQTACLGALEVDTFPPSLTYNTATSELTVIMINKKTDLTLSNVIAFMSYPDGSVRNVPLNITLAPQQIVSTKIGGNLVKPSRMRLSSANCEGLIIADVSIP
jgi:flagellin-like protein